MSEVKVTITIVKHVVLMVHTIGWDMYKELRNNANRENRRLKSEHFKSLIEENKSDSKRMWKCLKDILFDEKSPDTFGLQQKNCYITDPSKMAEAFYKHFSTTGKKLARAFGKVKAFIIFIHH